jgi:hypothetical protein
MYSTILIAMLMAGAGASDAQSGFTRKAYGACIQKLIKEKVPEKLSPEAFTAAAKTGCATQEAAFRKALIDYDLATKIRRADAEEGATAQVEDVLANAADTYTTYATPK